MGMNQCLEQSPTKVLVPMAYVDLDANEGKYLNR